MTVEKKQVLQMVDYIDDMETKMDMVMKDLKEMREQISGIKNQGIRAKAEQIVAKVSERMEEAGKQLGILKKTFLEKAGQVVRAGKKKGRDGKHPPSAGDDGSGTASSAESDRLGRTGNREAGRHGRGNV